MFLARATAPTRPRQIDALCVRLRDDFGTVYSSLGYLKSAIRQERSTRFVAARPRPRHHPTPRFRAPSPSPRPGMDTCAEGVRLRPTSTHPRLGVSMVQCYIFGGRATPPRLATCHTSARSRRFHASRAPAPLMLNRGTDRLLFAELKLLTSLRGASSVRDPVARSIPTIAIAASARVRHGALGRSRQVRIHSPTHST